MARARRAEPQESLEGREQVEVAIIGGGLAGSTLAAALAEGGHEVVLLEKDRFPRNKVCGEFLSPEVVDCLVRLGALDEFLALKPSRIRRSRLTLPGGQAVELDLPGAGYGLSRRRLDRFLFALAGERGAKTFEGVEVRAWEREANGEFRLTLRGDGVGRNGEGGHLPKELRARILIGAYGRRSHLDRKSKRAFFERRTNLMAYKAHFRSDDAELLRELEEMVELHTFEGGYCGVSFVEEGVINVCTLFDSTRVGFDPRAGLRALGEVSGELKRRFAAMEEADDQVLAVAQVPLMLKERSREGMLYVGDAASMIAPLAGDGQAMAMESALELAELLDGQVDRAEEEWEEAWERAWRRRYERRVRLGGVLQKTLTSPGLTGPAMAVVSRVPKLGEALVRWTRNA